MSPVTSDLSGKTPSEIDTELFPLWAQRWSTAVRRHGYVERLENHHKAVAGEWKPKSRYESNPTLAPYEIQSHERQIAKYDAELADLAEKISPLTDEFDKRGGWERFDFVPDGHLHKRGCHTLFPTTERLILAEASGKDHKWIVDNFAYAACTVCFPDAPVQARDDYLRERSAAKKGSRQAAAEAKAAKEAEKNLVEPVRVDRSTGGETIRTLYAAKQWLKSFHDWMDLSKTGDDRYHPSYRPADADRIRHALVLKGITEDELAAMEAKWIKAAAKEREKFAKDNPQWAR